MVDDASATSACGPAHVGVVGAGLIGGSIARAFLRRGVPVSIVEPDVGVRSRAEQAGAKISSLEALAAAADVVFVCPPPNAVAEVWRDWTSAAARTQRTRRSVVLDAASVKRPVREGVERLGVPWATDDAVFMLSHPMAGRERTGWDAGDPALFVDAPWVLLPHPEITGEELVRAIEAIRPLGATVCFMAPDFHDRFAGLTSHVAHALAFVFQAQVDAIDPAGWRRFSGNSLRDLLRVAGSDHDLWTEILTGNEAELRPLLRELAERLAAFDPARDVPATPPRDPAPDATGPDGEPVEVVVPLSSPIGELASHLQATGERGWHLDHLEVVAAAGEARLRFGAPVASKA